ncbi:Mobile element protein [Kosakonia radicincitans]|nr:Mobile element protein [Kosakonia radicincitans]
MSIGSAILFTPGISLMTRPHSALNYQTPSEFAVQWRNGKLGSNRADITN